MWLGAIGALDHPQYPPCGAQQCTRAFPDLTPTHCGTWASPLPSVGLSFSIWKARQTCRASREVAQSGLPGIQQPCQLLLVVYEAPGETLLTCHTSCLALPAPTNYALPLFPQVPPPIRQGCSHVEAYSLPLLSRELLSTLH